MAENNYHHGDLKNELVRAGIDILIREGLEGLSLRKVARRAGVSHSAPYAHFEDKQALIAAISGESFRRLHAEMESAAMSAGLDAKARLIACGLAYINFAQRERDVFKVMFTGILEQEKKYPEFVESSKATFEFLVKIVRECQDAGVLRPAPTELLAVAIWGQVHGVVSLALEKQISHTVLDQYDLKGILLFALNQFSVEELS
jgi:AcrR family transcriptional regulator